MEKNNNKYEFCSKQHFLYLKGIAIISVLIAHIGNYSGKTWFTPLGGIGVAIFLFCSGYGLMSSYSKKGVKSFWKNKLVYIYIPFAITEIVAAIVLKYSITEIILDLLFVKCMNPLGWYMQYLIACYFTFWLGAKYIHNKYIQKIVWCVIAVGSFWVFDNLRAEQAISFLSGIFFFEYYNLKKEKSNIKKLKKGGGITERILLEDAC